MSQQTYSYLGGKVTLYVGDLTQQAVDAIVNAANSSLMGAVASMGRFTGWEAPRFWKPAG